MKANFSFTEDQDKGIERKLSRSGVTPVENTPIISCAPQPFPAVQTDLNEVQNPKEKNTFLNLFFCFIFSGMNQRLGTENEPGGLKKRQWKREWVASKRRTRQRAAYGESLFSPGLLWEGTPPPPHFHSVPWQALGRASEVWNGVSPLKKAID